MKYRRLAFVAVWLLPCMGYCGGGDGLLSLRSKDGFSRAAWSPADSPLRIGGHDISFGLAAGPTPAVRSLSGGSVQPVFPMLSMPLAGRSGARLALIPRAGRAPGAMLAVQIPTF